VSLSDVQTPAGWTKIQVIWDLSVTALDSASCRYTNRVLSYPTPAFLETLKAAGISFEDAVADRQAASDDHNRRETALYAQSLSGRPWPATRFLILFRRRTNCRMPGIRRQGGWRWLARWRHRRACCRACFCSMSCFPRSRRRFEPTPSANGRSWRVPSVAPTTA
jgi:hypothetical protein